MRLAVEAAPNQERPASEHTTIIDRFFNTLALRDRKRRIRHAFQGATAS